MFHLPAVYVNTPAAGPLLSDRDSLTRSPRGPVTRILHKFSIFLTQSCVARTVRILLISSSTWLLAPGFGRSSLKSRASDSVERCPLNSWGYRWDVQLVIFTTLAIIACLPCCWASGNSEDEGPEADPTVLAFGL